MSAENHVSLGTIYLPSSGTGVGVYDFIVDSEHGGLVEVGAAVTAETTEGVVVGTVVNMRTVGYHSDPFAADLLTGANTIDGREELLVATVQVQHSELLRSARAGRVRAATPEEIAEAAGENRIDWKIPAGVVELINADGTGTDFGRICLDGHFLLGPEGAHVSVGGLSGLASKTSYAGVLLRSAIDRGSEERDSTAALLFNVKGDDLLFLDEGPQEGYELSDEDLAIYEAMGVPATPFPDVTVYAPALPVQGGVNSPREDAHPISWSLQTIWPYLKYFWPWMYDDDKVSGFIDQFGARKLRTTNAHERIDTFAGLFAWMDAEIAATEMPAEARGGEGGMGSNQYCWDGQVHVATMRKLRRMFSALPGKGGGLLPSDADEASDIPTEGWRHGQVIVVDVACLTPDMQAVVIARTVERLLRSAEQGQLGVDHLVVLSDEANQFMPAQGSEMKNVRRIMQKLVTTGRYAGLSCWALGQKVSKIDEMVRDNTATQVLGRCAADELTSGVYGRVADGLAERILTMPKGRMALWHYTLRAPMIVRFPRPAWRTGKAKTAGNDARRDLKTMLGVTDGSLERLTKGLDDVAVSEIVASASTRSEAVQALQAARTVDPADVRLVAPAAAIDPNDPFSFDD